MDDQLLGMFARALWILEEASPGLDDLLLPSQSTGGENAGKPANAQGSKPPVSVAMLDLKVETLDLLAGWCGFLVEDCPEVGASPSTRTIPVLAGWLQKHLPAIESMPWSTACAEEIIAQSRFVDDLVNPGSSVNDPQPIEEGSCREVARWTRVLGRPVHYATVSRWARAGLVSSRLADDGRVVVNLGEVMEYARHAGLIACATPDAV